MTWTVACFCGNVYSAPPDRCEVCGHTVEARVSGETATHTTQNGADLPGLAGGRVLLTVAEHGPDGSPRC